MPNWCSNRVTVWSNDELSMRQFKDFVKGRGENESWFSFDSILPLPEELRNIQSPVTIRTQEEIEEYKRERDTYNCPYITQETSDRLDEEYGENNWYDWSNNNWGVKWDCCDVQVTEEFGDTEITYTFDTPWGPPEYIHRILTVRFPEVHISWFWDEPGMEQAGYLK